MTLYSSRGMMQVDREKEGPAGSWRASEEGARLVKEASRIRIG